MCLGQNLDMGITPCPHLVVLVRGCWQGAIAGEEVGVADADVEGLPAETLSYFYKLQRDKYFQSAPALFSLDALPPGALPCQQEHDSE